MKKLWQAMLITALAGMAVNSYADVQNIRLSGDIRIRGYYTVNTDGDSDEDQVNNTDSYISQRTRVTVEADLEDHILIVVTLKAEGLWGQENDAGDSSGAGTDEVLFDGDRGDIAGGGGDVAINRRWEVGITEAYVQFSEMFYSPVTLKLGRQYLHYGRGLIISSVEQEYNFDAARLVLDYYPLTVDLVYATGEEDSPFGGSTSGTAPNDSHVLFANARYEMTDSLIKNLEGYFGWLINSRIPDDDRQVPPTAYDGSPLLVGARADINLTEGLVTWVEGAYEWGPDGTAGSETISAFIGQAGLEFSLPDMEMSPVFNAQFTYASGGGEDGKNNFRPWFDYQDGYNGYLFSPLLSNIMIVNAGVTIKPYENTTLSLQGYYYRAANTMGGNPGVGLVGNPNIDNGGLGYSPSGSPKELGWEIDGIVAYDYSKDVSFQLVYGVFIPENAYTYFGSSSVAHEVRAEVNARF